jgi:hypothetical protein
MRLSCHCRTSSARLFFVEELMERRRSRTILTAKLTGVSLLAKGTLW